MIFEYSDTYVVVVYSFQRFSMEFIIEMGTFGDEQTISGKTHSSFHVLSFVLFYTQCYWYFTTIRY